MVKVGVAGFCTSGERAADGLAQSACRGREEAGR